MPRKPRIELAGKYHIKYITDINNTYAKNQPLSSHLRWMNSPNRGNLGIYPFN